MRVIRVIRGYTTVSVLVAATPALRKRTEIHFSHESRRKTVCFLKSRSGKERLQCDRLNRNLSPVHP